jgi:hypothetical protein
MAKKGNFKELLMKKGEKLGLIAAVGVFILFLLIGVSSMSGAVNPVQQKQKIDQAASGVQRSVEDATTKAAPLPNDAVKPMTELTQVSATAFPNQNATFEPVNKPSSLRDNPLVKSPIESQVNYFAGSYKGYDRQFSVNNAGELSVRVGVLKVQTKQEFKWEEIQNRFTKPKTSGKGGRTPPPGPMGAPMQPPPLNPGGAPPAPPAIGGGEGAMPPGPGGRPGGAVNGERDDLVVSYMSYDEAIKSKLPPARTIYPIRMAVVQLSFPLKEQLEEIKRSLRLPNLAAAKYEASPATIDARSLKPGTPGAPAVPAAPVAVAPAPGGVNVGGTAMVETGDSPAFLGLVVERRVTGPDGQASGWEAFDHQEKFFERFTRYDTPYVQEDGYLPYFLRPYQGLSAPLPVMAGGYLLNYPPNVSLQSIYANYQKLLAERAPKKVASELEKIGRKGETNPYAPAPAGQPGNQPGGFGGGEENRAPVFTPPPAGGKPGMVGETPPPPAGGNPAVPGTGVDLNKLEVEYILLRYLDSDLRPGHTYEYRVKVKMKNPNFNNPTMVANESMAAEEVLESAWYDVPQKVTVPAESFLYAYSAKKYEDHVKKMFDDAGKPDVLNRVMELKDVQEGRKVVVQMQRWQEYLTFGNKQEPIGAWIQAEMPVGPGDYIGRRTLVELPLWRSSIQDPNATKETADPYSGGYTLPSPDAKQPMIAQWPAETGTRKYTLPRARILDFRTRDVLIDFDGGRVTTNIKGGSTQVDDAAADLLILREDGKIEIRKESIDMANTNPLTPRAQREKTWDEWLARVRKQSEITAPGTPGGPATPFGPVRGGSGSGG